MTKEAIGFVRLARWKVGKIANNSIEGGFIMDLKVLLTTFGMVFLAELGDKTQLATFGLAAEGRSRIAVFIGAAAALMLTSLIAVIFGAAVSRVVPAQYVKIGAGALFIILGVWILLSTWWVR
jgi:Ca2+/H+ antiporter, TMEM165/GDT1 family